MTTSDTPEQALPAEITADVERLWACEDFGDAKLKRTRRVRLELQPEQLPQEQVRAKVEGISCGWICHTDEIVPADLSRSSPILSADLWDGERSWIIRQSDRNWIVTSVREHEAEDAADHLAVDHSVIGRYGVMRYTVYWTVDGRSASSGLSPRLAAFRGFEEEEQA